MIIIIIIVIIVLILLSGFFVTRFSPRDGSFSSPEPPVPMAGEA